MFRALLIAAYVLAPDCQRLCLGVCHFDWMNNRCADTRVAYLGTWDPIPLDYTPPNESSFPAWSVQYPKQWGEYPAEKVSQ